MTVASRTDRPTTAAWPRPSSSMSSLRAIKKSTKPTALPLSCVVTSSWRNLAQSPMSVANASRDLSQVVVDAGVGVAREGAPQCGRKGRVLPLQGVDRLVAQHHELEMSLSLLRRLLPVLAAQGELTEGHPGTERAEGDPVPRGVPRQSRSEEHTSELQSRGQLVCRLLLEKK